MVEPQVVHRHIFLVYFSQSQLMPSCLNRKWCIGTSYPHVFHLFRKTPKQTMMPHIFSLPEELLEKIFLILWTDPKISLEDVEELTKRMPLVCKRFYQVLKSICDRQVIVSGPIMYYIWYRKLTSRPVTDVMNTRCLSLKFILPTQGRSGYGPIWDTISKGYPDRFDWSVKPGEIPDSAKYPGQLGDGLAYFVNGHRFKQWGLLPNLRVIYIEFRDALRRDPSLHLFTAMMPHSVEEVHVHYFYSVLRFSREDGCFAPGSDDIRVRIKSPIGWPKKRHRLKVFSITGYPLPKRYVHFWARMFEVETFKVDGLEVCMGNNPEWDLDMNDAMRMIEWGCKGIGWNWHHGLPSSHYRGTDLPTRIRIYRFIRERLEQNRRGDRPIPRQMLREDGRIARRACSVSRGESRASQKFQSGLKRSKSCEDLYLYMR